MPTKKQILILFLIASEPGTKDIYSLTKLFDRVDFPSRISENIDELLQNNLIFVSENFENGTVKTYNVTEVGKQFLKTNFNDLEIIEYIKELDSPELILEITKVYINKKDG